MATPLLQCADRCFLARARLPTGHTAVRGSCSCLLFGSAKMGKSVGICKGWRKEKSLPKWEARYAPEGRGRLLS